MTREEMLKALDEKCDEYGLCSTNPDHVCPMWKPDEDCPMCHIDKWTDTEIESLYIKIFGDTPTTNNPVTHPSHYTQGNIQCIDAMVSAFGKEAVATFCHINAFKYLWRTEHKNGIQDIDKAIWYLNKFKELKASGE